MKQSKFTLVAFLTLGLFTTAFSQKVILKSGDFAFLSGQKTINIEYDYSAFGVGDYEKEAEYVDKKTAEYNKKEAGRGDKFKESWERDKTTRFPEKFEELINKGMAKNGFVFVQNSTDAQYTLIVKTVFVEPGYNIGISSKPAAVSLDYIFVETADHTKELARLTQKNIPGAQAMGYDFDAGTRISEAYAKGAKSLAAFIVKQLKQ